jgi:hypothetical protein
MLQALTAWGQHSERAAGIILTALVVTVTAAFFFIRSAENRVTDDLVSCADGLVIPGAWSELDNIVRREQLFCMDIHPMPAARMSGKVS